MRAQILAFAASRLAARPRRRAVATRALVEWLSPERRRRDGSRKWTRFPEDVLPVWVADGDAAAPPAVRDAVAVAAAAGIYGYADPSPDLLEKVRASLARSYEVDDVPAAWLRWHPGLIPALYFAARIVRGRVAATPRLRDVNIPWTRVAATPRLRRGYSVETGARLRFKASNVAEVSTRRLGPRPRPRCSFLLRAHAIQ